MSNSSIQDQSEYLGFAEFNMLLMVTFLAILASTHVIEESPQTMPTAAEDTTTPPPPGGRAPTTAMPPEPTHQLMSIMTAANKADEWVVYLPEGAHPNNIRYIHQSAQNHEQPK